MVTFCVTLHFKWPWHTQKSGSGQQRQTRGRAFSVMSTQRVQVKVEHVQAALGYLGTGCADSRTEGISHSLQRAGHALHALGFCHFLR